MITEKDGLIKRRFKHVTDDQAIELALRIESKMKEGCSIEDALMYCQAYACVEELLALR